MSIKGKNSNSFQLKEKVNIDSEYCSCIKIEQQQAGKLFEVNIAPQLVLVLLLSLLSDDQNFQS